VSHVADRWFFYRERGLDVAGNQFLGTLTPELAATIGRLQDILIVAEAMEVPTIRVTLEVPPELEDSLRTALSRL